MNAAAAADRKKVRLDTFDDMELSWMFLTAAQVYRKTFDANNDRMRVQVKY